MPSNKMTPLDQEAYEAIQATTQYLISPRGKLAACSKASVASALLYVAEELLVIQAQEDREKMAELAYQIADQLGART